MVICRLGVYSIRVYEYDNFTKNDKNVRGTCIAFENEELVGIGFVIFFFFFRKARRTK